MEDTAKQSTRHRYIAGQEFEPAIRIITWDYVKCADLVSAFPKRCRDRYSEKMRQQFVDVGLLQSTRGPAGGYRLTQMADKADLREIWHLLYGDDQSLRMWWPLVDRWRGVRPEDIVVDQESTASVGVSPVRIPPRRGMSKDETRKLIQNIRI